MPREEPFFRKCCFCIPLTSCLQVWSCLKSIADLSLAGFLIAMEVILSTYGELKINNFTLAHAFLIIIPVLFIDSAFMVVLTVGLCTKNLPNLRVFYFYSFFLVFIESAIIIWFLIFGLVEGYGQYVWYPIITVCLLINTGLDVGIIFTLKSEMIKLRNKQQYEFVKMPNLNINDNEAAEEAEESLAPSLDHEPIESAASFDNDREIIVD